MTAGYLPYEDDDEDPDEGDYDDEDEWAGLEDEIAWLLRPKWLHPDCVNTCAALELGTCCRYPDNPLVRVAVELADSADGALRRLDAAGDHPAAAAELSRLLASVPGLLAQVHAILPRLNPTAIAQLVCPVGRLAGAVQLADTVQPARGHEAEPLLPLLRECSQALRAGLGRRRR